VYRLTASRPELTIVVNGGIEDLDAAVEHLRHVDGVMLGRAAYQTPYILSEVDRRFFGEAATPLSRGEIIERLLPYAQRHVAAGGRLNNIARHVLGLYHGQPRARAFRRHLSERAVKDGAGIEVLLEALEIAESERALMAAAE
jgi:tRNA-dihydrouridine synthase A